MIDINFILNGSKKPKKVKKGKDPLRDLMTFPSGIIGDRVTNKQKRAIKSNPFGDWDGDRVINGLDCQPRNKRKHMAIRFGRKPNNLEPSMWNEQKEILKKTTHKNNPHVDPRLKMNTVLEHDKVLRQKMRVHPVWRNENWQRGYNQESVNALKEQGYNDEDANEFMSEKSKRKMETANYFAQELARDEQVGHMFKGAIPQRPISDEEGLRRYKELEKYNKFIKIGSIQKIKPQRTDEDEMHDFMEKQEQAERDYFQKLKNTPKSKWSKDDKEFYDSEKDYHD